MSDENQQPVTPVAPTQDNAKPAPIIVPMKYTYNVYQVGFYRMPMFELSIFTDNPEKVKEQATLMMAQNVSNPKLYTLELKSVEVLEEIPNAEPKNQ